MSRSNVPFYAEDISALARSLVRQIGELDTPPGHLQLLNALARASGFRNFQSYREGHARSVPTARALPAAIPRPATSPSLLRHFDEAGRLLRWSGKASHRLPLLWAVWAQLPARLTVNEREINHWIQSALAFEDYVLIRRELVNHGLLARTPDGRVYRRVEQAPPESEAELVAEICRRAKLSIS